MQVDIRHAPSFAVARCTLAGGEHVKVEAGAMMATSDGVALDAKMEGGLLKGLRRSVLGGESLFITSFHAPPQGGWVDVSANLPGDIVVQQLDASRGLNLSRGSWLASEPGVSLDTQWGGFKNLAGGEGGFLVHATGTGTVVLGCFGAIDLWELGAGERLVLDAGHMVAYDAGVQYELRRAAQGRTIQSMKSGEGLVFEFTGPGRVWGQSRNPGALVTWLANALPTRN